MAGVFTGGTTQTKNGVTTITSGNQTQGATPLSSIGRSSTKTTDSSGLKLSNTGNTANIPTNMYGMITARPGGKLNEAEVTANAALASAYGQAAINRPDQYTPYGSSTWATDPETGQATNRVTLDPSQQELLDSQTRMQTGLAGVGSGLVDQVREQYSTPLDFSGAPQIQNGTTTKGVNRPNLQYQIDMSGVPSLVGGQDLLTFQNEARDAAWNNAKAALDPQWNSYETGLETKLANQGVMQGSDAWNKAMSEMSRNRQYDYSQAQNNAVSQGLTAAQQLYGQGLSSNQNAYNQALGRGNFTNAAQALDFRQNYQNAELNNSGINQDFNNSMSARGQYINELMTQRNAPLSALTSIMNGTQPSMPDFTSTNAVGGINSADTMSGLSATKQANAAQTAAKYAAAGNIISSGLKAFS